MTNFNEKLMITVFLSDAALNESGVKLLPNMFGLKTIKKIDSGIVEVFGYLTDVKIFKAAGWADSYYIN